MKKRKDSENFPALEVEAQQKKLKIQQSKSETLSEMNSKTKNTENEPKIETIEELIKKTQIKDIKKIVEEPNEKLKQKLKQKRIINNRNDIVKLFDKLFDKIKINKNLLEFDDLVIVNKEGKPTLEEIEPTKPKELKQKHRKSKQSNFRKNTNEVMLLTKGKNK